MDGTDREVVSRKRKNEDDPTPNQAKKSKLLQTEKLPYKIEKVHGKHIFGKKLMRRYKGGLATDTVYDVAFLRGGWEDRLISDLTKELTEMWRQVIHTAKEDGALSCDLIRIHISHRDLTKGDIKIPLQRLGDITPEAIMGRIAMILQSYDHLKADNILEISVGVIKFPRGEAAMRNQQKIINLDTLRDCKRSLTLINNNDNKCLTRALAVSEAWEKKQQWDKWNKNKGEPTAVKMTRDMWLDFIKLESRKQLKRADELIKATGLSLKEATSFAAIPKFEAELKKNVVVIASSHANKVIYPQKLNPQFDGCYYLYYIVSTDGPGHFHSVKSPTALMSMDYFCKACLQGYKNKHNHRCQGTCEKCKSDVCTPHADPTPRSCRHCHVEFVSQSCFDRHLVNDGKSKSVCSKFWQCRECRRYFATASTTQEHHKCDHYHCKTCERQVQMGNHHCYQRSQPPKKPCEKFIFFDFESTQESGEHIPNLVVAQRNDLKMTGNFTEHVFRGDDVRTPFGAWLFSKENKGYTVIAHNMKGYDGMFLLNYLVKNTVRHEVIYQGSKIMTISVQSGLNMRVIDSLNFFPMPLSKLPSTFGFGDDLKKGDFPHHFNVKEHYGYVGGTPALKYYDVDRFNSSDREAFVQWHDTIKDDYFDFEAELLAYCKNDVRILSKACLKFRSDFMEVSNGLDPFRSLTIASATMAVFKKNFLRETYKVVTHEEKEVSELEGRDPVPELRMMTGMDKGEDIASKKFIHSDIGITPSTGYTSRDTYSYISMAWLKWLEHQNPSLTLQHALTSNGEYRIPGTEYYVDGYDEATNTVYEFHGCLYHGCSTCYNDENLTVPKTGETLKALFTKTAKKEKAIKALGYKLVTIWEHQFKEGIAQTPELRNFISQLDIESRLNPRESFFGGRTNSCRLYYEAKPDEIIRYADFTSLYPYTNKYMCYPTQHPVIITRNFGHIGHYFGIAKVKVLPPKRLYHPVLPYQSNGKLKFPLCARCAALENQAPCQCSDEDRCLVGTWCTPEITKAIEKGYEVLKIYEVYHWETSSQYDPVRKSDGLFADFINTFLKLKQESSGWPSWCTSDDFKAQYIRDYETHEGIRLDTDQIMYNPGRRALAKLILNSFWGKYGQRNNLKQNKYVFTQAEFIGYMLDERKQVDDFHILNEDTCMLSFDMKSEFVEDCPTSNIVIASFTTCWARLKLYAVLEQVGRNCLYFDTDSVIFIEKNDEQNPVQLGDYLGELTNELKPGNHITTFVGVGPKNYAFRENDGNETCKVRGFTLNHGNSQLINYSTVRDLLLHRPMDRIVLPSKNRIVRDKYKQTVYNREEDRSYGLVYTKRRLIDNFDSLPFGHADE